MTDSVSMTIDGLDQMLLELRTLPQVIQTRVVKGMVAKGASVVRQAAIRLAPQYTGAVSAGHPPPGTLKKSIYQTRIPSECTATQEVWKVDVKRGKAQRGVKRGKSTVNLDAYYAVWVEFGHYTRAPHAMTKVAKAASQELGVARWVPARPFMRPAVENNAQAAFDAMQGYLTEQLPVATQAARYIRSIEGIS